MNEKSLYRKYDDLKFKKERFFEIMKREGYTNPTFMSERLGISSSSIHKWKKEYYKKEDK